MTLKIANRGAEIKKFPHRNSHSNVNCNRNECRNSENCAKNLNSLNSCRAKFGWSINSKLIEKKRESSSKSIKFKRSDSERKFIHMVHMIEIVRQGKVDFPHMIVSDFLHHYCNLVASWFQNYGITIKFIDPRPEQRSNHTTVAVNFSHQSHSPTNINWNKILNFLNATIRTHTVRHSTPKYRFVNSCVMGRFRELKTSELECRNMIENRCHYRLTFPKWKFEKFIVINLIERPELCHSMHFPINFTFQRQQQYDLFATPSPQPFLLNSMNFPRHYLGM